VSNSARGGALDSGRQGDQQAAANRLNSTRLTKEQLKVQAANKLEREIAKLESQHQRQL